MAISKGGRHKEYASYAMHCLETLTIMKDRELAHHSTPNGGRVDEAS